MIGQGEEVSKSVNCKSNKFCEDLKMPNIKMPDPFQRLPRASFARPGRLTTVDPSLVSRSLGKLSEEKRQEVATAIANLVA